MPEFFEAETGTDGWLQSNLFPSSPLQVGGCEMRPNKTVYMLDEQDDDPEMVRDTLCIKYCPLHSQCSHGAWSGHQPWTFVDPNDVDGAFHICISHLKYHLQRSGKHNVPESEVDDMIDRFTQNDQLVWIRSQDKYADRALYRSQCAQAKAGSKGDSKGSNKRRRRGRPAQASTDETAYDDEDDDLAGPAVDALVPSLQNSPDVVRQALLSMLGIDGDQLQLGRPGIRLQYPGEQQAITPAPRAREGASVTISIDRLRTVRESIRRAEQATGSILCSIVEIGKRVRTEHEVLAQNRKELDELIKKCR